MNIAYKLNLKKELMFTVALTMTTFLSLGCKENDTEENSCKECPKAVYLLDINNVTGIVKQTNNTDYIFNKNLLYVLIDTETELPELYAKDPQQKFIKVFSCSRLNLNNENVDKTIRISGKLYNCSTGDHGRDTNDIHTFKIIL